MKSGAGLLYHSSPAYIESRIEPRPSGVINGESAVFAATDRAISMIFLAKWTDSDIQFGQFNGIWAAIETSPGAFQHIFVGKSGYIYTVSDATFRADDRCGLKNVERISYQPVDIISREHVPDVWTALHETQIKFIEFDIFMRAMTKLVSDVAGKSVNNTKNSAKDAKKVGITGSTKVSARRKSGRKTRGRSRKSTRKSTRKSARKSARTSAKHDSRGKK